MSRFWLPCLRVCTDLGKAQVQGSVERWSQAEPVTYHRFCSSVCVDMMVAWGFPVQPEMGGRVSPYECPPQRPVPASLRAACTCHRLLFWPLSIRLLLDYSKDLYSDTCFRARAPHYSFTFSLVNSNQYLPGTRCAV